MECNSAFLLNRGFDTALISVGWCTCSVYVHLSGDKADKADTSYTILK